jgi:hypothetical protein
MVSVQSLLHMDGAGRNDRKWPFRADPVNGQVRPTPVTLSLPESGQSRVAVTGRRNFHQHGENHPLAG